MLLASGVGKKMLKKLVGTVSVHLGRDTLTGYRRRLL